MHAGVPAPFNAPETSRPSPRAARAWLLARAGAAAALLALLASQIEGAELVRRLGRTDPAWVAAGAGLLLATVLLKACRWHLLLRDRVAIGLGRVVRLTFISDFLMTFLPSGIGGDTARAWLISRASPKRLDGVSSVLADRLLGLWVMLLLGAVAVVLAPVPLSHRAGLAALLVSSLVGSAAALAWLVARRGRARRALERIPAVGARAGGLADRLLASLDDYRRDGRLLAQAALLTVALSALRVLMNYAFGLAVGSPASLYVHAAFVPLIFALNYVPVSVGDALGVREMSYVYLYALAGVPATTSLAMAVWVRLCGYGATLPGIAFYVLGDARRAGGAPEPPRPASFAAAPEFSRDPAGAARRASVPVDAHVHIHSCFDLATFLEAASANFAAASGDGGLGRLHEGAGTVAGPAPAGVLMLTEAAGENRFGELAALARAGAGPGGPGWTFATTGEECSLTVRRDARTLVVIAGRQVATSDGLEVLLFGTRERFEDGRPLAEVLERAQRLDLVHAVPWGAGKWFFRRGRLLTEILASAPDARFCLGDEGGRPLFWPRVRHFEEARRRGIRVLRGTDPLPFPSEVARAGGFGFRLGAPLDPDRPLASLRQALKDPAVELSDYGRLERPVAFFVHQWGMQRRKRARRSRPDQVGEPGGTRPASPQDPSDAGPATVAAPSER